VGWLCVRGGGSLQNGCRAGNFAGLKFKFSSKVFVFEQTQGVTEISIGLDFWDWRWIVSRFKNLGSRPDWE